MKHFRIGNLLGVTKSWMYIRPHTVKKLEIDQFFVWVYESSVGIL